MRRGLIVSEMEERLGQVDIAARVHKFHMKQSGSDSLDKADGAVLSSTCDENTGSGRTSQGGDRDSGISSGQGGLRQGQGPARGPGADRAGSGSGGHSATAGEGAGAVGSAGGQAAAGRVEVWSCGHSMKVHGPNGCDNPRPEAERAVESQLEPQEGIQEPDPDLDRRACKAAGIEAKGWVYGYKSVRDGWVESGPFEGWVKAETDRFRSLDCGFDTRSTRQLYPAVSSCPVASAQLCQAAVAAGLGWPVALTRDNDNGLRFTGLLQDLAIDLKSLSMQSGVFSSIGLEAKTPERAIALVVAAADPVKEVCR